MEEDLVASGRFVRIETIGRRSGQPRAVTVGFVDDPSEDGAVLVAAGAPNTAWALNLLEHPACRVRLGERTLRRGRGASRERRPRPGDRGDDPPLRDAGRGTWSWPGVPPQAGRAHSRDDLGAARNADRPARARRVRGADRHRELPHLARRVGHHEGRTPRRGRRFTPARGCASGRRSPAARRFSTASSRSLRRAPRSGFAARIPRASASISIRSSRQMRCRQDSAGRCASACRCATVCSSRWSPPRHARPLLSISMPSAADLETPIAG